MKAAVITKIRLLFKEWRETFLCCKCQCRKRPILTYVLSIGEFVNEIPTESLIMSSGKIGQFAEIIVSPRSASGGAGEVDPSVPFTYSTGDSAVAEIVESGDKHYVHLIGQGSSTVDVDFDGDPTDGSAPVHLSGLVVCDDQSDNATTGEVTFGAFADALPEASAP